MEALSSNPKGLLMLALVGIGLYVYSKKAAPAAKESMSGHNPNPMGFSAIAKPIGAKNYGKLGGHGLAGIAAANAKARDKVNAVDTQRLWPASLNGDTGSDQANAQKFAWYNDYKSCTHDMLSFADKRDETQRPHLRRNMSRDPRGAPRVKMNSKLTAWMNKPAILTQSMDVPPEIVYGDSRKPIQDYAIELNCRQRAGLPDAWAEKVGGPSN